ncbi:Protein mraZ [Mesomycoplasma conjunctivae]|uniref:Transcriptional regulator MraZ n=1 Tax=Mesomycoplasma conjunctivae (strain ATCC 25834 / NCTC 10147 / HRC/581) TaxID=572263 RepID=C5J696_MESCH|nr:division/cell wall cluster transcriptional repressor MraZ [Mesomycoplasma conjunctivae]CAT04988.1 Protein mraZ [Mesomycoplasma conjunctivae]VEU66351.1 Protein mraZ [Mesomycoplasma conjunctivae]
MFGTSLRILDEKNRIVIPPSFRENLGTEFYISINLDQLLEIRNQAEFDAIIEKITKANSLNKNLRNFARYFLGNSVKVSIDKQGRFLIPKHLLDLAAIDKKLYLVGVGKKIEIWPQQKYEAFNTWFQNKDNIVELEEELINSGVEL